jgi:hypothetical protein
MEDEWKTSRHVFQVMHMFLGQFGWISLKRQRSSSNYIKINWNWRFEDSMMKPTSGIYGMHDLKLWRGSYGILEMLQAAKPRVRFSRIRPESE